MLFGYVRAVVGGPTIEEQTTQLKRAGAAHVFTEKDPRQRKALMQALQAAAFGDVLLVASLANMARSVHDLISIYRKAEENGAGVLSISEPFTDPATPEGRKFGDFIGWLIAFDAVTRFAQMSEGRERAVGEGRARIGKPSKFSAAQWAEIRKAHADGESCISIAKRLGVHTSTISRHVAKRAGFD